MPRVTMTSCRKLTEEANQRCCVLWMCSSECGDVLLAPHLTNHGYSLVLSLAANGEMLLVHTQPNLHQSTDFQITGSNRNGWFYGVDNLILNWLSGGNGGLESKTSYRHPRHKWEVSLYSEKKTSCKTWHPCSSGLNTAWRIYGDPLHGLLNAKGELTL